MFETYCDTFSFFLFSLEKNNRKNVQKVELKNRNEEKNGGLEEIVIEKLWQLHTELFSKSNLNYIPIRSFIILE